MPWDQDRLSVWDYVAMTDEIDRRNQEAKTEAREARRGRG
jgi:hypothetical protein